MKPIIKPLGSLLAILFSASALVAQSTSENSQTSIAPSGVVAAGVMTGRKSTVKTKTITITIVKTKDTIKTGATADEAVGVVGEIPSQNKSDSSPKPKNQAKQDSIKRDQLTALITEQYRLLEKNDQYKGLVNAYALDLEMQNADFTNIGELGFLLQLEEECQLELLKKNLGIDQEVTLENVNQFLTEQEQQSFQIIQAALSKLHHSDWMADQEMNTLGCYDKTNKYKQTALFFELEYLNFLAINRQGSQKLSSEAQADYYNFKMDLLNDNYSRFHSDDFLSQQRVMIDWENAILDSQKTETETPATPPANDQPVADQPGVQIPAITPPANTPIISPDGLWYDEAGTEVPNLFNNSNPGTYHTQHGITVTIGDNAALPKNLPPAAVQPAVTGEESANNTPQSVAPAPVPYYNPSQSAVPTFANGADLPVDQQGPSQANNDNQLPGVSLNLAENPTPASVVDVSVGNNSNPTPKQKHSKAPKQVEDVSTI
ncbi:MAG: hypothetical protein K2W99_04465 [Chthoniobacterales bacterium]|nr:hypothetical protein [Chthoniobacterales bacterium]